MAVGAEARLQELGIVLPALPAPGGNYVPAKTVGHMVYLAGVISSGPEGVIAGTVGVDRTIEEGYAAARACALTQLAVLKRHLGSLDAVKSIVSVNGYVNAVAGFRGFARSHQRRVGFFGGSLRRGRDATCARPSAFPRCRGTRWSKCK